MSSSLGVPEWALPLKKKKTSRVPSGQDGEKSISLFVPSLYNVAHRKSVAFSLQKSTFEEALKFREKYLLQKSEQSLEAHRLGDEIVRSLGRARRVRAQRPSFSGLESRIDLEDEITRCDPEQLLRAAKIAISGSITAAKSRATIAKVMRKNQSMLLPVCKPLHQLVGENTRRQKQSARPSLLPLSPAPSPTRNAKTRTEATSASPAPPSSEKEAGEAMSSSLRAAPPNAGDATPTAPTTAAAPGNVQEDQFSEVSSYDKLFGRDVIVAYDDAVGRKGPSSSSLVQGKQCKVGCVLSARQAQKLSRGDKMKRLLSAQRTRRLHRPVLITREHVRKFQNKYFEDDVESSSCERNGVCLGGGAAPYSHSPLP